MMQIPLMARSGSTEKENNKTQVAAVGEVGGIRKGVTDSNPTNIASNSNSIPGSNLYQLDGGGDEEGGEMVVGE